MRHTVPFLGLFGQKADGFANGETRFTKANGETTDETGRTYLRPYDVPRALSSQGSNELVALTDRAGHDGHGYAREPFLSRHGVPAPGVSLFETRITEARETSDE